MSKSTLAQDFVLFVNDFKKMIEESKKRKIIDQVEKVRKEIKQID